MAMIRLTSTPAAATIRIVMELGQFTGRMTIVTRCLELTARKETDGTIMTMRMFETKN